MNNRTFGIFLSTLNLSLSSSVPELLFNEVYDTGRLIALELSSPLMRELAGALRHVNIAGYMATRALRTAEVARFQLNGRALSYILLSCGSCPLNLRLIIDDHGNDWPEGQIQVLMPSGRSASSLV